MNEARAENIKNPKAKTSRADIYYHNDGEKTTSGGKSPAQKPQKKSEQTQPTQKTNTTGTTKNGTKYRVIE